MVVVVVVTICVTTSKNVGVVQFIKHIGKFGPVVQHLLLLCFIYPTGCLNWPSPLIFLFCVFFNKKCFDERQTFYFLPYL